MRASPRARRLYRYDDWLEYLDNCMGLRVEENANDDYYNYIVAVARLRDLTPSEIDYAVAYDKAVLGVKRIE